MNQPTPLGQSLSLPAFDQIVKGNVSIKKLSKYRYRITFSKIGKFLMYQVWDKDNASKQNDNRIVKYVSAEGWVERFNTLNKFLKEKFTPTTIMETEDDCVYAFVIHKAYLNSCDKFVFNVSTEEISPQKNTSKKLIQLPEGKCNHVRLDIDGWWDYDKITFTNPSGCSIPDVPCTPEQARSELIEPQYPFYDFGIPFINTVLIRKIYTNKGKDMSDDEFNNYIKDLNRYIPGYTKCNLIMGEDCGNSSGNYKDKTVSYTRWQNAMNKIGAKCPGNSIFDPTCTTGCYGFPSKGLENIPFIRLFDSGYCLDPEE
jgi:hypothetical protein